MYICVDFDGTCVTHEYPFIGKDIGEEVEFGGLLGKSIVMPVKKSSCEDFINRQGRIPAPIHSQRN